jgi:hypothetical protein
MTRLPAPAYWVKSQPAMNAACAEPTAKSEAATIAMAAARS